MITKERLIRKRRIRTNVLGTGSRPRLAVYRSNKMVYAQLIDDGQGVTLAEAKGVDAKKVGEEMAKKMLKKKLNEAVFDRSGYKYHGKVKILCEAVREGGIKI